MSTADELINRIASSLSNSSLELIILPTEKCNFRCSYCYEQFVVGRMDKALIAGIKKFIDNRLASLSRLEISWFGGEPLLAKDVVEDICGHVANAAAAKSDVEFISGMTTNGYFLDIDTARRLRKVGVSSYQITLDGPKELHDTTRVQKNRRPSFDRIWSNLLALKESDLDLSVLLRIHLMPENVVCMVEFLHQIRETFICDQRFSVFLKPIARLGDPNNDKIKILDKKSASTLLNKLREIVTRADRLKEAAEQPYICYAAKPNSLVIRANGTVGKCTVALDDEWNHIGRLTSDGRLEIDNSRLRPWLRGLQSRDLMELECPLINIGN